MKNKQEMIEIARRRFIDYDFPFIELKNGQFQIEGVNFWATTQKWYDPYTGRKGRGIASFIAYVSAVIEKQSKVFAGEDD